MKGRYRKRPLAIDAIRFDGDFPVVELWAEQWHPGGDEPSPIWSNADGSLTVATLEGEHRGEVGDWIIRGIEGEFYPVRPSVFEATYEPVDRADQRHLFGA